MIRRGLTTDQCLSEAGHGVDNQQVTPGADGVGGKHHAGRAGVYHALYHHVHGVVRGLVVITLIMPGPFVVGGSDTLVDGLAQLSAVGDIQDRVVLARK